VTGTEDDSQQTLEDSFPATSTMPASPRRAKDITNAIGYFVAKDMMPISTTTTSSQISFT